MKRSAPMETRSDNSSNITQYNILLLLNTTVPLPAVMGMRESDPTP